MAGRGTSYTQEFKNSAIQLALNSEKSPHAISKELGISDKTLYQWLKKYRQKHNLEQSHSSKTRTTTESLEEENRRLRKELASVKKDKEILKKAAAYFAKEAL
jgi:transposase